MNSQRILADAIVLLLTLIGGSAQALSITQNPNLEIPGNAYNGGFGAGMACNSISTIGQISGPVIDVNLRLDLGIVPWIGDLVIKLRSPAGTTLTLLSRPGYNELADDGGGAPASGDNSNWNGRINFFDGGTDGEAETMGNSINTSGVACVSDGRCDFDPSQGVWNAGPTAFFHFNGSPAEGLWTLCVGDSYNDPGSDGRFRSWTLNLTGINNSPNFTSAPVTTADVGAAYSYNITTSDLEGDPRSITAPTLPAWLTLTDNGDGTASLTGTPAASDLGSHNVVLRVHDGRSAPAQQAFSITVSNASPSFTSIPVTAAEVGFPYNYAVTAMDSNGDPLAITGPTLPAWLNLTDNGDGTASLSGTPAAGDFGINSVSLAVDDGTNPPVLQNFDITVSNSPPSFTSAPVTTAEVGIPYSYAISTTDVNGDPLAISGPTLPAWLTLTDNGDGTASLSGTPAAGDFGVNAVVLAVNDGTNPAVEQSFDINVSNSPPSFTSTAVTTADVGFFYSYAVTTTDPNGDPLSITAPTLPTWLTLIDNGDGTASLTGTPTGSDFGPNPVVLAVDDGSNPPVQQSFVIAVSNAPPTFTSTPTTTATAALPYSYAITATDANGDALTIAAPTLPAWLSFADNGDGTASLTGTPAESDIGAHPVVLSVDDGTNPPVEQSFNITVTLLPAFVPCPSAVGACDGPSFPLATLIAKASDPSKAKLIFKAKGASTEPGFYGDPTAEQLAGGESHATCIYDASGNLILELGVAAAGIGEKGKPLWKRKVKATKEMNGYKNKAGNDDGVKQVIQTSGEKAKLAVKAAGMALPLNIADFTDTGLTVQHIVTDQLDETHTCSQAVFPSGSIQIDNTKGKVKAKIKP